MSLLMALMLLCSGLDDHAWIEFSPKDGSFVARFPRAPVERANRSAMLWQFAEKDRVFNVARASLTGSDEAALEAVRDNILKRVQAKLVLERKLTHQKVPAREYLFTLPEDKGQLRVRCLVLKQQVWEIKVGGPQDYVNSKEADTFLDSLKIK